MINFLKQKSILPLVLLVIIGMMALSCNSEKTAKQETNQEIENDLIQLKVAGYDMDRIQGIVSGKVTIEGCEVEFYKIGIGDANTAAFSGAKTYDVTEIGLHPFMLAYANDDFRDYTLIPVFPIRAFRHKSIFIHTERGITSPEDLKGRKIGTPGYSSTSLTWIRGILKDEYGVSPEDIQWILSNKDSSADAAGKISAEEQVIPDGINVSVGPAGMDESDLLLSGEVDALFHAAEPKAFIQGNPLVKRLFPDSKQTERDYFNKKGIFPIMHAVAIKTQLVEKYPWIPKAVFDAYSKAKTIHYHELNKIGWAYSSLPWFAQEYEETKKLMGENFWPYGIEANRKTLEALCEYSYNQGLSNNQLAIEDLFHHSTLTLSE